MGNSPIEIKGNWEAGYALDLHTRAVELLGYDEFNRTIFDTVRSQIGELVYRLKYGRDKSVILR
jgi:ribonuclease HII